MLNIKTDVGLALGGVAVVLIFMIVLVFVIIMMAIVSGLDIVFGSLVNFLFGTGNLGAGG